MLIRRLLCVCLLVVGAGCSRSSEDYVQRGVALYDQGKYEEASLSFRRAIQDSPRSAEAYYRLGLSELKRDEGHNAYEALFNAVSLDPKRLDARIELANLLLTIYQADATRPAAMNQQLRALANDMLALNSPFEAHRIVGTLDLIEKQPLKALDSLRQADSIQPMDPDVIRTMVAAMVAVGQTAEAERLALAIIEKDKTYGPIYDELGALYIATQRPELAEKILRAKVENNPKVADYRVQLATHYMNKRSMRDVETVLRGFLADRQAFPDAWERVGDFHRRFGNIQQALDAYRAGVRDDPKRELVYAKRIGQMVLLGDNPEASLRYASELAKKYPDDTETRLMHAAALLDQEEAAPREEANKILSALRTERPDDPQVRVILAVAQLRAGQRAEAKTTLQQAIRADPSYAQAHVALAELTLADGEGEIALRHADNALRLVPASPKVRFLHAAALSRANRKPEARLELGDLLSESPGFRAARLELAGIDLSDKRYENAERGFRAVYRPGSSDLRPLDGIVRSLMGLGATGQAVGMVQQELKAAPANAELRRLLARTAAGAGQIDLAINAYSDLARGGQATATDHYLLAQIYLSRNDNPHAAESLRRAEELDPANPVPISVLAAVLDQMGRRDEAKVKLRRVLELRPNDANILNNLAFTMVETGDNLDEALLFAQRAASQDPNQHTYADTVGWIRLKKGQVDEALRIFAGIASKNPRIAAYRYHYGLALYEKQDLKRARTELEAALSLKPTAEEAARIREILAKLG